MQDADLMSTQGAEPEAVSHPLAVLLDLSRQARLADSEAELRFLLVNDTHSLVPFRQAALWHSHLGIQALSGLVQPEVNAPYAQWLQSVCRHLSDEAHARAFASQDLPANLAQEWEPWWPAHGLWLPIASGSDPKDACEGGFVLAREAPWSETDIALLAEWLDIWRHALLAVQRKQEGFFRRWRATTAGPGSVGKTQRPWWRSRWIWILATLTAMSAFPVRMSVLAAGELVPSRPVVIRAPLEGVVDAFFVEPNQTVKKGQALFGFDEALIKSRLDVARQSLQTASVEMRQTTQQALADARVRTQLAPLDGRIKEKRAEVGYLQDQLERSRVLAPAEGIALFDDPADWVGKPVAVGERIMRIAVPGDVEVEAWLPIADAIALEPGALVHLYLSAEPLDPVAAHIHFMSHEAVLRPDGTYAYRIRATLVHPTHHRVGLKGTARIQGDWVPAIYWIGRRPLATLRSSLGF